MNTKLLACIAVFTLLTCIISTSGLQSAYAADYGMNDNVADKKLTDAKKVADKKLTDAKKVADKKLTDAKKVADKKLTDAKKVADKKAISAKKLTDKTVADAKKMADKKAIDAKKMADKKAIDAKKMADKTVADAKKMAETAAPMLGTAGNFAVLGGTTVTNTGNTVVIGDLGVSSPGVACTGFVGCTTTGSGTVSRTIHVGDLVANLAHTDTANAYGTLSSTTCTTNESSIADIGGQTLTPGVYCFPSSAAISGTLTLSGSGVYIFKVGSTLVTASNSDVVLTNGATTNKIFWAIGSSATLGIDSSLEGTVIAYSSITANAGTTVDGKLLAINGAVTLDTNRIQ
jgi:hypothetical protein